MVIRQRFDSLAFDRFIQETGAKAQANGQYMIHCPNPEHPDRNPSCSIKFCDDGKIVAYCFVCGPINIREHLPQAFDHSFRAMPKRPPAGNVTRETDEGMAIFVQQTVQRTIELSEVAAVVKYLQGRGIYQLGSPALRAHRSLKYNPGGYYYPAFIGLVSDVHGNFIRAIHRTWIAHDGSGKAPLDSPKRMLGNLLEGAVQLAPAGKTLMIGEGIETCLSAMQVTGLPAWAALSASRLARVAVPDFVEEIIFLADNDKNGFGIRAATEAARRWVRQGKKVRIAIPPAPGLDFNDMLRGEG